MFGRHLKREYRIMMVRVYAVDSCEPIGEKRDSFRDPTLQIVGVGAALAFATILLTDVVLPVFGLCEPFPAGNILPVIAGVLGTILGYYGVSESD